MEITYKDYKYSFQITKIAPDRLRLSINGQNLETKVRPPTHPPTHPPMSCLIG